MLDLRHKASFVKLSEEEARALRARMRARMRAQAEEPEPEVDWSVVPEVKVPGKVAISVRVDEDVLEFFRAEGRGYQTRMNAVLRSYMVAKRKPV